MADPRDEIELDQLDMLAGAFSDQLLACLEEAARGRIGLFSDVDLLADQSGGASWPEAERLRQLAMALQQVCAQQEARLALADEFLDLCSMHGESHPGERKLARLFLDRIEHGDVKTKPERESTPW